MHWLHDVTGKPYWSLAQHLKDKLGRARRYVDTFRSASLAAAADAGVAGIVCGHIHKPDVAEQDGLLYCNTGDWVENCTAVVENHAGEVALVTWRPLSAVAAIEIARDAA